MDSPPESTARWWQAWFGAVVVVPLVACGCTLFESQSEAGLIAFFALCALSLLLHFIISIGLAKRIAATRSAETRDGARIGLTFGLLFGGWAVIAATLFAGCIGIAVSH